MKLLLVAATTQEIQGCIDYLQTYSTREGFNIGKWTIDICITGVGMLATTFAITQTLMLNHFDFVLQAGIGGCIDPHVPLGSVIAVKTETLGDLGAEDHETFTSVFELEFIGLNEHPFTQMKLVNSMSFLPFPLKLPLQNGLTVNAVSGSAKTISQRYPHFGATVESMEGAALHFVCLQLGVSFLQVRAISNYITPRDRASWQIGKAIALLNAQLIEWMESLKQAM